MTVSGKIPGTRKGGMQNVLPFLFYQQHNKLLY
jgi:hypothetical protein